MTKEEHIEKRIGVATCTYKGIYETALLDVNGIHPVERYDTKEQSKIGNQKWLEYAKNANGKEITQLASLPIAPFVEPLGGISYEKKIILET